MSMVKNWEIKGGFWLRLRNLYRKGGFDPRFYLYRFRFNLDPRKDKVGSFPVDVIAEICNVCNLLCVMCFQVDKALPVSKTTKAPYMSMETFRKIVDECAYHRAPALKLSWRGEPMLNKNFTEMIRYAKSKGILEVTSLTNATLMDEGMCKEIVDARLDQLVISIDGFSKDTYEKIRVGADYDKVVGNINSLISVRGKKRKPFIRLQYTESAINRHETAQFYTYWNNKVDEITISYCQDFGSPQKDGSRDVPIHKYCCKQPFQRLVVMTDGTVCVCATDVMGSIAIGNVHESALKDLWDGQKINEHREQHKTGKYYLNPMCRICVHNIFTANKKRGV
ncbi:MAG: radical SAM protein [Candidatus Omnitrophica bacterium]|nr:radical SAM protein [Candidatus Omnitrophota bacterium]